VKCEEALSLQCWKSVNYIRLFLWSGQCSILNQASLSRILVVSSTSPISCFWSQMWQIFVLWFWVHANMAASSTADTGETWKIGILCKSYNFDDYGL